jgi:hypothetical protein
MARDRLIGNYGKVAKGTLGTAITTGTLTAGQLYIAKVVDAATALPTGIEAGYPFTADGTEDITSTTDEAYPLTLTDQCDVQNWSLEFSANEVDVTTLCDQSKVYEKGRVDPSGNIEGVFTLGITDQDGGFANNFVDIVSQADDGGAITINKIDDSSIYLILYKQKDDSSGETETFYIVPSVVLSFSDNVTDGEAQSFSSSFRPTNDDEVKFVLYENTIA